MKTEDPAYTKTHTNLFDQIFHSKIMKLSGFLKLVYLVFGCAAITIIVYLFSFLIDNKLDWRVLLFLNPNSPVPVIDSLMILVTDFSMGFFTLIFLFWEIDCQITKHTPIPRNIIAAGTKIIGAAIAIVVGSAHFWAGYAHSYIFFPLALIQFITFWLMGNRIVQIDQAAIDRFNRLFWLTALTVLVQQISVQIIKEDVARLRPLSGAFPLYARGIRTVADEVVQGGYSYVAGHSATLFAMVTPLIFFTPKKWIKAALILWALVHAYTRVYVAAHFPYDSLMGAVLGFCMGALVIKIFGVLGHSPSHRT